MPTNRPAIASILWPWRVRPRIPQWVVPICREYASAPPIAQEVSVACLGSSRPKTWATRTGQWYDICRQKLWHLYAHPMPVIRTFGNPSPAHPDGQQPSSHFAICTHLCRHHHAARNKILLHRATAGHPHPLRNRWSRSGCPSRTLHDCASASPPWRRLAILLPFSRVHLVSPPDDPCLVVRHARASPSSPYCRQQAYLTLRDGCGVGGVMSVTERLDAGNNGARRALRVW